MPTNRIEGRTSVFADWAWQALLVVGVCSVLLGVALIAWPNKSEELSGALAGLVLGATAAVQLIVAFGANIAGGLRVLEFFAGVVALLLAIWSFGSGQWVLLLALWIGMGWMIRGVVQAITAAWTDFPGSWRPEVVGLGTAAAGMVVAVGPFGSSTAFSVSVGLLTIALGVSEVCSAARLERTVPETV
ncbi:DUF308 domain-containing protein [Nocardia sp. 2]|uniref:DUF308 domain-containing protein n=1 Tax=Nocardia acididurans TaxID=2802282 RepID=A0ABS1M8Q9_9NOCA|nr:DUF308 domain-containing protein [Nocardia acididurans]MBL1077030.1 DUF308 domain-containing protein [Nocardia acididurans]